jgi:hypothetical protein
VPALKAKSEFKRYCAFVEVNENKKANSKIAKQKFFGPILRFIISLIDLRMSCNRRLVQ